MLILLGMPGKFHSFLGLPVGVGLRDPTMKVTILDDMSQKLMTGKA